MFAPGGVLSLNSVVLDVEFDSQSNSVTFVSNAGVDKELLERKGI